MLQGGDLWRIMARDKDRAVFGWYRRCDKCTVATCLRSSEAQVSSTEVIKPGSGDQSCMGGLELRSSASRGKQVALDVACGLHWLHTHRIVHFDLKVWHQLSGLLPGTAAFPPAAAACSFLA